MNKKRLVGGEFLIDLSMILLTISDSSESFTAITNQEVLAQLTDLKTYVKNQKSIKPIWVKLKDNDSFIVTRGELQKVNNQPNFVLVINANGKLLTIKVEFTQVLNDDDVPMDDWYIDTNDAQYNLYVSDVSFIVDDVKSISDDILNQLKCGDVVIKKTGNQYHAYIVTFKNDTGICLTYMDASVIETQSYDKVDDSWVYNSEDKSVLPVNVEDASFKPVYIHPINIANPNMYLGCFIFNNSNEALDTKDKLYAYMRLIQESLGEGNTARFPSTGSFTNEGGQFVAYSIEVPNQSSIKVYGRSTIDGTASSLEISSSSFSCFDGVNKIN